MLCRNAKLPNRLTVRTFGVPEPVKMARGPSYQAAFAVWCSPPKARLCLELNPAALRSDFQPSLFNRSLTFLSIFMVGIYSPSFPHIQVRILPLPLKESWNTSHIRFPTSMDIVSHLKWCQPKRCLSNLPTDLRCIPCCNAEINSPRSRPPRANFMKYALLGC